MNITPFLLASLLVAQMGVLPIFAQNGESNDESEVHPPSKRASLFAQDDDGQPGIIPPMGPPPKSSYRFAQNGEGIDESNPPETNSQLAYQFAQNGEGIDESNPPETTPQLAYQRDSYYIQTDDEYLSRLIQNILEKAQRINIRLSNGVITLTGEVDSEQEKETIKDKIRKFDNELQIEDRLTMKVEQSTEDRDLQRKIEGELKKEMPQMSGLRIYVVRGTVIITGPVANSIARQELKERIRKIAGVKIIDDQMEEQDKDKTPVKKIDEYYLKQKSVSQVEMSRPAFEADRRTLERVRDLLSSDPQFRDVAAETYDGKIWLSGVVSTSSDKETVEKRVGAVEGVHHVDTSGLRIQKKSYMR